MNQRYLRWVDSWSRRLTSNEQLKNANDSTTKWDRKATTAAASVSSMLLLKSKSASTWAGYIRFFEYSARWKIKYSKFPGVETGDWWQQFHREVRGASQVAWKSLKSQYGREVRCTSRTPTRGGWSLASRRGPSSAQCKPESRIERFQNPKAPSN